MKKSKYLTTVKWIDPNGNGIITTLCSFGLSSGEAEKRAVAKFMKVQKNAWGTLDGINIRTTSTDTLEYGIISERKWNNPK